jgi:CRP-like cAMP-binding protein
VQDETDLKDSPPPHARLDRAVFDALFSGCPHEHMPAGRHIFLQEDPADRLYGIVSGRVEIAIFSLSGRKLVANLETPGSLVGEIAVLDGGRRTATATCLTDCTLVSLSRARLFERIETSPAVARAMIGLLCARLRWVSGELGDQALLKIEARLAKRILFLSRLIADTAGWIAISQAELSEFLGATRESVNKTLNDWRAQGLIEVRRGGIRARNPGKLSEIAREKEEE